jgi:hypothetical protein
MTHAQLSIRPGSVGVVPVQALFVLYPVSGEWEVGLPKCAADTTMVCMSRCTYVLWHLPRVHSIPHVKLLSMARDIRVSFWQERLLWVIKSQRSALDTMEVCRG